jgi:hypothetical protein
MLLPLMSAHLRTSGIAALAAPQELGLCRETAYDCCMMTKRYRTLAATVYSVISYIDFSNRSRSVYHD